MFLPLKEAVITVASITLPTSDYFVSVTAATVGYCRCKAFESPLLNFTELKLPNRTQE